MSIFKINYQEENLSLSLRWIAVGLTGLPKRLFSYVRKILWGKGECKSLLHLALAAILATLIPIAATLIPIADAQAQPSCPIVIGSVTNPPQEGGEDQECDDNAVATPAVGDGDGDTGGTVDDNSSDAATPSTPVMNTTDGAVETSAASGGSDSNSGITAMGLLALLLHYGLDQDQSESELGHHYAFDSGSAKNRSRRTSGVSRTLGHNGGIWARPAQSRFSSYGASYFGAISNRMSWDIHQSGNYFLRANISPASSVSPSGWQSSASGDTLSLTGGWQGEGRRLQLGITHGRYDANAKLYDSSTKGNLFGESEFVHTSVHASAVQELSGGPMKLSSSASLMAGQVEQAPYAAENAVMRAKVPAYRQSYAGFRLGFSANSRKWLELSDGTSVKPHLKFTAMRTHSSASDPVQMRQSDKVGALGFHYESVLQGVPESLNLLGVGVDVKPTGSHGVWRLGYAGMQVDGEYQHAAVAAYRMQF